MSGNLKQAELAFGGTNASNKANVGAKRSASSSSGPAKKKLKTGKKKSGDEDKPHVCRMERNPVPGETYDEAKAKINALLKTNTRVETTVVTDRAGNEIVLECMYRLAGFPRQVTIPVHERCHDPACPEGNHEWTLKAERFRIQANRVKGLPETAKARYNPKTNSVKELLTTDHLCHDEGGHCENPQHLDHTSLEVNKGRNGCPGPNAGCMHGMICKPCLIPGVYSGNRQE